MVTDTNDQAKINYWYFERVRPIEEIVNIFNGKYTYREIKEYTRNYINEKGKV